MRAYTLTIYIAPFNRSDIFVKSLQNYLKADKNRACFTIQYNSFIMFKILLHNLN